MTFSGEPGSTGNSVLKAMVVIAIVFVAFWAIRGGYQSVDVPVTTTTSSTTTTSTSTTTTSTSTTTTTLPEPEEEGVETGEDDG